MIRRVNMNQTVLTHHGIPGQKWCIRRFQRPDGSLTPKGQARLDKKDNKWASTKGEKIKTKVQKKVSKDMDKFAKTELEISYTPNGRLSSSTILQYNNKMASLMNDKVSGTIRTCVKVCCTTWRDRSAYRNSRFRL